MFDFTKVPEVPIEKLRPYKFIYRVWVRWFVCLFKLAGMTPGRAVWSAGELLGDCGHTWPPEGKEAPGSGSSEMGPFSW